MRPARAFLFDVDSTLIQTGGAGRRALNVALSTLGAGQDALAQVRLHGRTDRSIVHEVLQRHLLEAAWEAMIEDYLVALHGEVTSTSDYQVLPGVQALLERLRDRGAFLGLATGNVRRGAHIKLTRGGLLSYFSFGGFGDRHEARADLVREARAHAERLAGRALARDEVVVIGDSELDVHAAHAADCGAVGVATGQTSLAELRAAGAEWVYEDLAGALTTPPFG